MKHYDRYALERLAQGARPRQIAEEITAMENRLATLTDIRDLLVMQQQATHAGNRRAA